VTSTCGSKDGVVHDRDVIELSPRGHVRFEAAVDGGRILDVICAASATPLALTVAGNDPPWLAPPADVSCGAWSKDELVCSSSGGEEVLVCSVVVRTARAAPAAPKGRTLEVPAWFVGELPPAVVAPPVTTRIAVYQLGHTGLDERTAEVTTAFVTAELRKLAGVSVIGMDEVKAMLDVEAEKQLTGCDNDSCLSEIAAALGVDAIVTGGLAAVADQRFLTLKRIDQREARVAGQVSQQLTAGNGEEFLGVVGPAVLALFPDVPLKPGRTRGVAPELAVRLNPPPFEPWVFWTGVGITGASLVGTGVVTAVFADDYRRFDVARNKQPASGLEVLTLQKDATNWGIGALTAAGVTVVCAIATASTAGLVDWQGYRSDIQLESER
jgi:hypothetical protein